MQRLLLLAFVAAFAAGTATAANWPSWRGPNQDGSTPEVKFPTTWSRTNHVKWRTALPEAGNSSPVVWGDTVFVTQAVDDGKSRTLLAFDRATGTKRWQKGANQNETEPHHQSNPHGAASPVTDGERVVVSYGSAGIVAYDFAGRELWRTGLGRQTHDWGQGSSPVIFGDWVIVYHGPGQFSALHGLDKKTGEKKWSVPLKEQRPAERFDGFAGKNEGAMGTFSTPLVITAGGREEIILPVANKLRAFAPATGRELWSADGMNPLVYGSATYGEGRLIAMGGFFGSVIFIKPGGEGDMTEQRLFYDRRMKKHTIGSPIVKDGHIYLSVTDGFLQCYELANGKLMWEERLPASGASGQTWASMALAGDRLYAVNQSGDTFVLRAAPKFEVIAVNPLGELSNSTPALSDGEIFLRTHEALYCISERKPAAK